MKKKEILSGEDGGQNTTGWLTTFNDLITLLMVFFVLIYALSSKDEMKMKVYQRSFQSALGVLFEGKKAAISVGGTLPLTDMSHMTTQVEGADKKEAAEEIKRNIEDSIETFDPELKIKATITKKGVYISLGNDILFNLGSADIRPGGYIVLDRIAAVIQKTSNHVRVEGHTDNVPINTKRFPSNWELSTSRAVNVIKYLAQERKIKPQRLSAVGYGESKPVFSHDTPENRARNRRVEIVIVTEDNILGEASQDI